MSKIALSRPLTGYAELQITTNFSFLEGGSHPHELIVRAAELGLSAVAITDHNSVAGLVRAHLAASELDVKMIVGCRLSFIDGAPDLLCYPQDRAAYGRLCRLLTIGKSNRVFKEVPPHPTLSPRGEGFKGSTPSPRAKGFRARSSHPGEVSSGVPSPQPYPLADMATQSGNLAKARLREKDRMSVYDRSQAYLGASASQKRSWVMSVFAMTTSFRITAVRATFGCVPAPVRRS